ncbi:GGDEF domain-containing protein (plasmid) [Pontibacillus sp. ALD_SL1]|uniref:GGDEF domain-containing protein n=1 Tax=Pontibacillus sp. ALD_SL1 TaxID=2777185 RepID=UPI001A95E55C|nr:GGDEF domain-containing protein [Pontibacillus sp. ALD_SL1]QST02358.1 GGDEF domain-containing protein [Pontibacillus sp. ALD_SL1]
MSVAALQHVNEKSKYSFVFDNMKEENLIQELVERAYTDELTQCNNRRYLSEYFQNRRKFPAGEEEFLFYFDLNDFKPVNDRYGHKVGDELLKGFANLLKENVRQEDFVCRLGGDEFCLFVKLQSQDEKHVLMKRLQSSFRSPIDTSVGKLNVQASIGYAQLRDNNWEEALAKADEKMYEAKKHKEKVKVTGHYRNTKKGKTWVKPHTRKKAI